MTTNDARTPIRDEPPWEAQSAEWLTSAFNFEGSESSSSKWELRVCDVAAYGNDSDTVSGWVDSFEIEFHAL